jgi:hypothetical protein
MLWLECHLLPWHRGGFWRLLWAEFQVLQRNLLPPGRHLL